MAGPFDLIMSAMGRPTANQILAQGMGQPGQAPGQPGQAPGQAGQAPGQPGQPGQAAPQQPQLYSSPQDMLSMYAQLMDYQQRNEMFNRAVGGIAAGLSHDPDRARLANQWAGMTPDAGKMMGNILALQQNAFQLQQQQAFLQSVPDVTKQLNSQFGLNLTPQEVTTLGREGVQDLVKTQVAAQMPTDAMRNYTQFQNRYVEQHKGDVGADGKPIGEAGARQQFEEQGISPEEAMLGVMPGDPMTKQMRADAFRWQRRNQGQPLPPQYQDVGLYQAQKQADLEQSKDVTAAHAALPGINERLQDAIDRTDRILGAKNLGNVLGPNNLWMAIKGGAGFGGGDVALARDINQLGQQVYGQALGSEMLKGSRKTQAEASGVAGGLSQVNQTGQDEQSYRFQLGLLRDMLVRSKANATAAAGVQPSGELAGYEDPSSYDQGAPLAGRKPPEHFVPRPRPGGPAVVSTPEDVAKLPPGTPFIIPSGPHKGETGYAK